MTQFMGYRRPDGSVGVRNIVAVVSAMDNTNPCASRIADIVDGTIAIAKEALTVFDPNAELEEGDTGEAENQQPE